MIAALAAVVLHTKFETGQSFRYDLTMRYVALDGSDTTQLRHSLVYKVKSGLAKGTALIDATQTLEELSMNGQVLSQGDVHEGTSWTEKRNEFGQVFERPLRKTFPVLLARQTRGCDLKFPDHDAQVGEKWTLGVPEDSVTGLPGASWSWELTQFDKTSATIHIEFAESDVAGKICGSGDAVIDPRDGWVTSMSVTVGPTVVPGDEEQTPVNLTVTLRRKDQ